MHWKTVGAHDYLYHKVGGVSKSLGPRSAETEATHDSFQAGRNDLQRRKRELGQTIQRAAPVDRAMGLGRIPETVAKILRRLDEHGLLGRGVSVIGTNALFAYERKAGGHFESGLLATGDVDLLVDARRKLRLIGDLPQDDGLESLLRKIDPSFRAVSPGAFRATNDAGLMIDLIEPMPRNAATPRAPARIGRDNLQAIEEWLLNAPRIDATVIDERGFPLRIVAPDPRAFALHKLWVSERPNRDPFKATRDRQQAQAVAILVATYLPDSDFDADGLSAVPAVLRTRAAELLQGVERPTDNQWQ